MKKERHLEDCIFCLDCGKDITEERVHKGMVRFCPVHESPPFRYCDNCVEKAKSEGYYFTNDTIDGETVKTSWAIEQMAKESLIAYEQSLKNQYF